MKTVNFIVDIFFKCNIHIRGLHFLSRPFTNHRTAGEAGRGVGAFL